MTGIPCNQLVFSFRTEAGVQQWEGVISDAAGAEMTAIAEGSRTWTP